MPENSFIWELAPTDAIMVKIRTEYFNNTGHYGSDDEIKAWYTGENKNNPYSTQYKEPPSA